MKTSDLLNKKIRWFTWGKGAWFLIDSIDEKGFANGKTFHPHFLENEEFSGYYIGDGEGWSMYIDFEEELELL